MPPLPLVEVLAPYLEEGDRLILDTSPIVVIPSSGRVTRQMKPTVQQLAAAYYESSGTTAALQLIRDRYGVTMSDRTLQRKLKAAGFELRQKGGSRHNTCPQELALKLYDKHQGLRPAIREARSMGYTLSKEKLSRWVRERDSQIILMQHPATPAPLPPVAVDSQTDSD